MKTTIYYTVGKRYFDGAFYSFETLNNPNDPDEVGYIAEDAADDFDDKNTRTAFPIELTISTTPNRIGILGHFKIEKQIHVEYIASMIGGCEKQR